VNRASQTAVLAAQVRAAHALLDPDPIFEDHYALLLADATEGDVRDLFAVIPVACARVARVLPVQRARYVDEEVGLAVSRGVDQYVLLGAGLDSFAWRRPDLMAEIDLFEVDHPATQAWKQRRLEAAGLARPPRAHFIGSDLAAGEDLSERLGAVAFDPRRASIWSWLGVIVYLEVEAIASTMSEIAELSAPGSRLIASYTVTPDLMDPESREFDEVARAASLDAGEPHLSVFAPAEIEGIARDAGWPRVHSVDPSSFAPWFSNRHDGLAPASYEWLLVADA
jgi:methyltransferase (TIGR00027 family)